MPPTKYHTAEERKEAHRITALKYARKNSVDVNIKNVEKYKLNKVEINARRRERYAAKKAAL